MTYRERIENRITDLRASLESGTWPTLEGFIKGKIEAYETVLKDIDENLI